MKDRQIKVTLRFLGGMTAANSKEYRIEKIENAITVGVPPHTGGDQFTRHPDGVVRVGDMITEVQAENIAMNHAVIVLERKP